MINKPVLTCDCCLESIYEGEEIHEIDNGHVYCSRCVDDALTTASEQCTCMECGDVIYEGDFCYELDGSCYCETCMHNAWGEAE